MGKVDGQRQYQAPSIPVEQSFLLIIEKQKGSTQDEIRQKGEVRIYFSDFEILTDLRELEALGLVRSVACQSMERWYSVLEVA